MKEKYRIVTNGLVYKIQRRIDYHFLWWKWHRWVVVINDSHRTTYVYQHEAERELQSLRESQIEQSW